MKRSHDKLQAGSRGPPPPSMHVHTGRGALRHTVGARTHTPRCTAPKPWYRDAHIVVHCTTPSQHAHTPWCIAPSARRSDARPVVHDTAPWCAGRTPRGALHHLCAAPRHSRRSPALAASRGEPPHCRLHARRICRSEPNPASAAARVTVAPYSSDWRARSSRISRR